MSSPPKKAALKVVVANWLTPPPMSVVNSPSWITPPSTKPFSVVRRPTVSLTENVVPGGMSVPRRMSAIRWMLVTRDSQHLWLVVNDPMTSFTPSPAAHSLALRPPSRPGSAGRRWSGRPAAPSTMLLGGVLGAADLGVLAADRGRDAAGRCRSGRRSGWPCRGPRRRGSSRPARPAWSAAGCRRRSPARTPGGTSAPSTSVDAPPALSVIAPRGHLVGLVGERLRPHSSLTCRLGDGQVDLDLDRLVDVAERLGQCRDHVVDGELLAGCARAPG